MATPLISFDNSYARDLEGLYDPIEPEGFPDPTLVQFNSPLAKDLGLDASRVREVASEIFSGNRIPEGAEPIAQAYAGHQFGSFNPQLGDGRAFLLGEVLDENGHRWDLQLKGAGRTPFSRSGDGRATVGPILREYLLGEAMHHLGVPTTRVLAALRTGETVIRGKHLPGAVLCRVASSHIRIGTFEFFKARGDVAKLEALVDYTLDRHVPADARADEPPAFALLCHVAKVQANLIAQWMQVGFIHGVMNTDNVAVSGETIDFGPCAFMETFNPETVFSSIDRNGRYAYGNQPTIGAWNMTRLAEALVPLLGSDLEATKLKAHHAIRLFVDTYQEAWLAGMRRKLGLAALAPGAEANDESVEADEQLTIGFLKILHENNLDFTSSFRRLSCLARNDLVDVPPAFQDAVGESEWAGVWKDRITEGDRDPIEVAAAMDLVNPLYIARNEKVEQALAAAIEGDMKPFNTMLEVVSAPFEEREQYGDYTREASEGFGPYQTFCGT